MTRRSALHQIERVLAILFLIFFVTRNVMAESDFTISSNLFASESALKIQGKSKYNIYFSTLPKIISDQQSVTRLGMLLRDDSDVANGGKMGSLSKCSTTNGNEIIITVSLLNTKSEDWRIISYRSIDKGPFRLIDDFSRHGILPPSAVEVDGKDIVYKNAKNEEALRRSKTID